MSSRRLILHALVLILSLTSLAWFAIGLTLQPGMIPVAPLAILAGAAILGGIVWLTRAADDQELAPPEAPRYDPLPFDPGSMTDLYREPPEWLEEVREIAREAEIVPAQPEIPVEPPVLRDLEDKDTEELEIVDVARDKDGVYRPEPVRRLPDDEADGDIIDAVPDSSGVYRPEPVRRPPAMPAEPDMPDRGIPSMEPPERSVSRSADIVPDENTAEDAGGAVMEPEPAATDDTPVQFAAFYPREVKPDDWQPLKAYILRESAYPEVVVDARDQFDNLADIREVVAAALEPIPEDALVTAIPRVPGLEFDPPQASARFRKAWRRFDFEFRAVGAPLDESADGHITFYVEGVVVADIKLSVYVSERAAQHLGPPRETSAKPYQSVFCSYSHRDMQIVERVEVTSRLHFTRFLRDVTSLRSGERWSERLLDLIEDADIFQLFWSAPAAESDYVRQEWEYALALRKNGAKGRYFIRPVCWEEPLPAPPPPELADLHFEYIKELAEE